MTTYLMTIEIDEGWQFMETGITKLKRILEGLPEPQFTCEEYMILYTTIYNMCIQKPPHNYSQQLYDKYKEAFYEYINSTVLLSLRGKHDEFMLRELVKRWTNHKVMVRWLSRFFSYLDRYFIPTWSLPTLTEAGLTCFRDTVYEEFKDKAKYAVIALIDREREGEQIDRALLKNVLDIYVEIGMGEMKYYENDFEKDMLADSAAYYSRKASICIAEDYGPDYLLKAEDCMRKERERVSHYLHSSSEPKLLENVLNKLLAVHSSPLLEKEHSEFYSLLQDNKVDDLSRMHRLFSRIVKGLDPVSNLFKQMFVRKVIELYDRIMTYVTDCFMKPPAVSQEAFEVFCNKDIAGSSGGELLASYCDNILKKGGNEKLSDDEAIEETLDKAAVLVLFNVCDRLSYSEIKNWLNLADEDAVRILQFPSCAKYKILTKEPNTKSVSQTDYF